MEQVEMIKKPKTNRYGYQLLALILLVNIAIASTDIYQFATLQDQQRFQNLTWELRCLVCQNQSLAESNAGLATGLREQIAQQIRQGQSNQAIINYLVNRYGDYILYKPPLMKSTYILWFFPFILLLFGFIILVCSILRMRK